MSRLGMHRRQEAGVILMNQTCSHHLLPVMLISLNADSSHTLTISNKEEHREDLRQPSKCCDNECVLQSHLGDPRGDAAELCQKSVRVWNWA